MSRISVIGMIALFVLAGALAFFSGLLFAHGRVSLSILAAIQAVLLFLVAANAVARRVMDRYTELLHDAGRRWR